MSKNNEFVKFDKVDKSYDGKLLVVKDLNLDIAEGEFITMLDLLVQENYLLNDVSRF